MRVLVLDDDDIRHEQFKVNLEGHDVVHVHTVEEAGNALAAEKFDLVYLDHDLNDHGYESKGDTSYGRRELTGFEVARYIAQYLAPQKHPTKVIVHSWNPPGARMMVAVLRDVGIPVTYEPFNGSSGAGQSMPAPADTRPWVSLGSLADLKADTEESTEGCPDHGPECPGQYGGCIP